MPKLSQFIIGMIFISFIMAVLALFMADINEKYSPYDYDSDTIDNYNKLTELQNTSKQIQEDSSIEEDQDFLDVIGGYFSSAYNALRLTGNSVNVFTDMSDQAVEDAGLGATGEYLKIAITSAIIVIIFLAIIMAAIFKRDL
jgi:hypothetical protein